MTHKVLLRKKEQLDKLKNVGKMTLEIFCPDRFSMVEIKMEKDGQQNEFISYTADWKKISGIFKQENIEFSANGSKINFTITDIQEKPIKV